MTEETIRVATAKLDALLDGMGELLVARMRTEQRLAELRTLQQQLTRWQKRWRQVRAHYKRLQRQEGPFLYARALASYFSAALLQVIRRGHVRGSKELNEASISKETLPTPFGVNRLELWQVLQERPALQIEAGGKSEGLRDRRKVLQGCVA